MLESRLLCPLIKRMTTTTNLPPKLQPLASFLDAQPPEVQEAFQFLLAACRSDSWPGFHARQNPLEIEQTGGVGAASAGFSDSLLATAMHEAGKFELLNIAEVDGRWYYTFSSVGEVFSVAWPEMSKEMERGMKEEVREILEEEEPP